MRSAGALTEIDDLPRIPETARFDPAEVYPRRDAAPRVIPSVPDDSIPSRRAVLPLERPHELPRRVEDRELHETGRCDLVGDGRRAVERIGVVLIERVGESTCT